MATYDINWSATLDAAATNIGAGDVVCPTPSGDRYVLATASNLAAVGRVGGIALTNGAPLGNSTIRSIVLQYSGEVPASITGLGAGDISAVRVGASGRLERIVGTPSLGDYIMGDCDVLGAVTLSSNSRVNPFIGGGIASVGGTLPITSTGGDTPAIAINPATESTPGSMSAADKTKLDGLPASPVTSVGATAPITSTGGATPNIGISPATESNPGSLSAADKTKLDGITAGAAVASVSGTAPIVSSGGTTPAISISPATTSNPGSLSAADKTKLDAITGDGFVQTVGGAVNITTLKQNATTKAIYEATCTASANHALAIGDTCVASAINAVALGYQTSATGANSFAVGEQSQATAEAAAAFNLSVAEAPGGFSCCNGRASGSNSFSSGEGCRSSGDKSFTWGESCSTTMEAGTAHGVRSKATRYGQDAFACGKILTDGDAQTSRFVYFGTISAPSQTVELTGNGVSVLTLDASRSYSLEATITYACVGPLIGGRTSISQRIWAAVKTDASAVPTISDQTSQDLPSGAMVTQEFGASVEVLTSPDRIGIVMRTNSEQNPGVVWAVAKIDLTEAPMDLS